MKKNKKCRKNNLFFTRGNVASLPLLCNSFHGKILNDPHSFISTRRRRHRCRHLITSDDRNRQPLFLFPSNPLVAVEEMAVSRRGVWVGGGRGWSNRALLTAHRRFSFMLMVLRQEDRFSATVSQVSGSMFN